MEEARVPVDLVSKILLTEVPHLTLDESILTTFYTHLHSGEAGHQQTVHLADSQKGPENDLMSK